MSKNFSDKLLVKVTGMGVDLRKLADKRMLNPILSMLEDLKKELAATLERVDPTAVVRASAQQARVKALFDQTTETIRSGYKDIVKAHAADLRTLASVQAELIGGTINNLVGVEIMTTTLSGQQLSSIASNVMIKGAPSREWWRSLAVWEARELMCRRSDCLPLNRAGRRAEYLWSSPPGSVRQTG